MYTPGKDVDKSELPGHHLFEKPGMLTNDLLINAYISARDLFLKGDMSETSVKGYLGTLFASTQELLIISLNSVDSISSAKTLKTIVQV